MTLRTVLAAAFVLALLCGGVQADTIGYWRFESETEATDSSGHGNTGVYEGTKGTDYSFVSGLCNPVPLTGDTNTKALNLLTDFGYVDVDYDSSFYSPSAFTIEAMIKPGEHSGSLTAGSMAGIWGGGGSTINKSWRLRIDGSGHPATGSK